MHGPLNVKINRLIVLRPITAVYCESHTAHVNIVCVERSVNVEEGGACNYHCALKGRTLRHSAFLSELYNTAVTGVTRILTLQSVSIRLAPYVRALSVRVPTSAGPARLRTGGSDW